MHHLSSPFVCCSIPDSEFRINLAKFVAVSDAACQSQDLLRLQVGVIFIGKRHVGSVLHFFLVLLENFLVNLDLRRSKRRSSNEFQRLVADEFASEPADTTVSFAA